MCHLARRRHHQLGGVPALEVRVHEHRLHVDLGHVLGRGALHPPPVRREVGHELLQQNTACSWLLSLLDIYRELVEGEHPVPGNVVLVQQNLHLNTDFHDETFSILELLGRI